MSGLSSGHRGTRPCPRRLLGNPPRGSPAPGAADPALLRDSLGPSLRPPRCAPAARNAAAPCRRPYPLREGRSAAAQPGREGRRGAARLSAHCPRSAGGRAAVPHRPAGHPPGPPPGPPAPSAPAPLTCRSRGQELSGTGVSAVPASRRAERCPFPGSLYGRVPAEPSPHRRGRPAPQELRRQPPAAAPPQHGGILLLLREGSPPRADPGKRLLPRLPPGPPAGTGSLPSPGTRCHPCPRGGGSLPEAEAIPGTAEKAARGAQEANGIPPYNGTLKRRVPLYSWVKNKPNHLHSRLCQLSGRASDTTFEHKAILAAADNDKYGLKRRLLLHRKYAQDTKLGICLRYETICGTAGT